jgi:tetratricopeptide (TPR) repeat protein
MRPILELVCSLEVNSARLKEHKRRLGSKRRLILFILASIFIMSQHFGNEPATAQSVQGHDPKYNSGPAAVNHMILGLDLLKAGTPEDLYSARQNFLFIINMKERDAGLKPEAYLNLGVVEMLEGNSDAAIKNYLTAIQLRPNYPEAYFNLGGIFYKQGLLKKAEEAFVKAIELQPDYGRAHYSLGFVYLDQKKYDLARNHAEKAAEYGVSFRTLKEKLAKISR